MKKLAQNLGLDIHVPFLIRDDQVAKFRTEHSGQPESFLLKNGVFWDVTPFGFYKNRRFGGT
jgi:hypothetical protein